MKKVFILLSILTILFVGCVTLASTPEQEASLEEVRNFPEIGKDDLYNRALSWVARSYNSANDVIQLQNPETGQIICKGVGTVNIGLLLLHTYHFNYTFIIDAKDYKIRTRFEYITSEEVDIKLSWDKISSNLIAIKNDMFDSILIAEIEEDW